VACSGSALPLALNENEGHGHICSLGHKKLLSIDLGYEEKICDQISCLKTAAVLQKTIGVMELEMNSGKSPGDYTFYVGSCLKILSFKSKE
jgi:hypothetical protein